MKQNGYEKVAVYGYGILGKHLCNELQSSEVTMEFIIDQRREHIEADYKVYLPTEVLPEIDAIIVSAVYEYESIYRRLRAKGKYKIISLETILYENEFR